MGREREGPKRFLGNFEGILQSDGYGAYDHVGGPKIAHAACWAHARGKFFEAVKLNPRDQTSIRIVQACQTIKIPFTTPQPAPVYPVQTVHLNIGWLPSDSKFYLAKRAAAKAQRLVIRLRSCAHCGSDAHRAIRCFCTPPALTRSLSTLPKGNTWVTMHCRMLSSCLKRVITSAIGHVETRSLGSLTVLGFASAQALAGPAFIPFDMFLQSVGWSNGTAPE
jgi:hypothetical protein